MNTSHQFVLVRGIFLDKKMRIAPAKAIRTLVADYDYLQNIGLFDAVILDLGQAQDRRALADRQAELHDDLVHTKRILQRAVEEVARREKKNIPAEEDPLFELDINNANLEEGGLIGFTVQPLTLGKEKREFGGATRRGLRSFTQKTVEDMVSELQTLRKKARALTKWKKLAKK